MGVRIAHAALWPIRLPLHCPLPTAHGPIAAREGALLRLQSEDGVAGWGEALPLPGFGLESRGEALGALEQLARRARGRELGELEALLDECEQAAPAAPSARAAIDLALHDLAARSGQRPLAELLAERGNRLPRRRVAVCALVTGADASACARAAKVAAGRGHTALKLKLGMAPPELDVARVAAVREAVGEELELRLDANGAWDEPTARRILERLARHRIAFVEQPVTASDVAALARLRAGSPIPLAADEAVRGEVEARRLLDAEAADLLVVKPAAVGGLRAASRIAGWARSAGVEMVVTNFLDSALGTTAALHFAAALSPNARAAGLATGGLLRSDLGAAPPIDGGAMEIGHEPGLGPLPQRSALCACTSGPVWEMPG